MVTVKDRVAMAAVVQAVLDTIRQSGPNGAPSGVMYAALSAHGMTLQNYQAMMGALVRVGKVTLEHDCYFIKEA